MWCTACFDPERGGWLGSSRTSLQYQHTTVSHERPCEALGRGVHPPKERARCARHGHRALKSFTIAAFPRWHNWRPFGSLFQEHQTLQQLMWQPDVLQVVKFLHAGVNRMQGIDPDAGSNLLSARLAGTI